MKFRFCILALFAFGVLTAMVPSRTQAQSAVLSEIYGRGVHAYHSGQYQQAGEWLSMAIDNGFRDPRAYYFRGLVAASGGNIYEAEADFQEGAKLEATGTFGDLIGRSLARIQGSTRLKLEQIREKARLQALATGQARSNVRYGELGVAPGPAPGAAAAKPAPASPRIAPPSAPSAENPFADDMDQDATVESPDAFKDAMENAAEPEMAGGKEPVGGDASPFGGDAAPANDPFGGSAPASDPFGAPGGGADPFGGSGEAMDDPFGASPF
ncbi:hypothetical protein [Neorhodopirellula pilleata]|uniref:Tetratricopeptide repeat protein n=1 Tax=Neorhodopirellula pilleata TaxID=2714738 RepID=A0A5C6ALK4_9BACT|nr:hypothetical protein [Neorhodopirellula pilleata]TWT99053.1 hypothetical protein Pla100_22290 [Neorhodopirellula pilleata]